MTSIIGMIAAAVCMVVGIFTSKGGALSNFWSGSSVFVTIGGTFACIIASYPGDVLKAALKSAMLIFKKEKVDIQGSIDSIIEMANIARREGLLALENATEDIDNRFMKKGVMLIVDGSDPELVKNIMETEIAYVQDRHNTIISVFDSAAGYAPAFGMIGTLIGLINMLLFLNDAAALGPNMGIALITTLYGSMLANILFNPISKKLRVYSGNEELQSEIILEGILSIQNGENPRIIREKLEAFVSNTKAAEMSHESDKAVEE